MQDQMPDAAGRYPGATNMDWSNRDIVQHVLGREANYSMNIPNEQALQDNSLPPSLRRDSQPTALEQSELLGNRASAESDSRATELKDDAIDE